MKNLLKLFLATAISFLLILPNISASATEAVQNINRDQIIAKLTKEGVPEATQKGLLEKLDRGELWDSLNPDKQDQASKLNKFDGTVKYTYPDGSYKIVIEEVHEVPDFQVMVGRIQYNKVIESTSYSRTYESQIIEDAVVFNYMYYVVWSTAVGEPYATIRSARLALLSGSNVSLSSFDYNSSSVKLAFSYGYVVTTYVFSETYVYNNGLRVR